MIMASAKALFSKTQREAIIEAIRKAEMNTSGEIRVHVEDKCDGPVYEKAIQVFHTLGMQHTPQRNAVLIYIAVEDRKFAVIGDEAIHHKVTDGYWKELSKYLLSAFKAGHYSEGITGAIDKIGDTLMHYFPDTNEPDKNKLPDDISFE